ncbi:MAG: PRC-barrel domain-containing protein [Chloroflexota bacterium]|nr:PRC-barrel domain-containing protein [Chloroflexota bacterium]
MTTSQSALHTVDEDSLEFVVPDEDVRGRTVLDEVGEHIGVVDALLVADAQHRVRFLRVKTGGLLGLGDTTSFLIPIDAATSIDDNAVHVDQALAHVGRGPVYNPDLMDNLDSVLNHYGAMRHETEKLN